MHFQEETIDDLMMSVYSALLASGKANKATKGKTIELLGCNLVLSNPRARISSSESRGKIFSCLGELLWYLSGTGDTEFIKHYIKKYDCCIEENGEINGAYGPRIFHMHDKYDQFSNIIKILEEKSTTRRAVIQLFDARDIQENYNDVPCTLSLQFVVRNNKLDLYTMMRSNDAFLGLPHDIFCFTMLQEIISSSLGYELGKYHHFVVSLHIYTEHKLKIQEMQNEGYMSTHDIMPEMPKENFLNFRDIILNSEKKIRENQSIDIQELNINSYWKDILNLLEVYSLISNDKNIDIGHLVNKLSNKKYKIFIDSKINGINNEKTRSIK
ncbi:thymidylate synthase [Vibrio parahaemolyticus]